MMMPNLYSEQPPATNAEQSQHRSQEENLTTAQQLQQARDYLATLHSDRAESCAELEEEAKVFLNSSPTDEEERRFRMIYQLVRYQVRYCCTAVLLCLIRSNPQRRSAGACKDIVPVSFQAFAERGAAVLLYSRAGSCKKAALLDNMPTSACNN